MDIKSLLSQVGMQYEEFKDEDRIYWGANIQVPLSKEESVELGLFIARIEDSFGDQYIRLSIIPYVERPYQEDLAQIIAQINHDLFLIRFAFDSDGDLELICDLLETHLDVDDFKEVLEIVGAYAGAYYKELSVYTNTGK